MKIENVKTEKLLPAKYNPRKYIPEVVEKLKLSITSFDVVEPLVINKDNTVIGGHQRLRAMIELGMKTAPCVRLDLTKAQEKALNLALNKITSEFDDEMLAIVLAEIRKEKDSSLVTGFDDLEIDKILNGAGFAGKTDEDQVPDPPKKAKTKLGDMFQLGNHRLLCGDSTNAKDVKRLLRKNKPMLMVTDPPYGVSYDPKWRERAGVNTKTAATGKVASDDRTDWYDAWALFPGDVAYVWCADVHSATVHDSLVRAGFVPRNLIVWGKSQLVIGRGHYHHQYEPCWYMVRDKKKAAWLGDRKQTTLWLIDKPVKSETGHSTQKPVECMARGIFNHKSEFVYEPFCGSGGGIIACEKLGRKCLAMEITPIYCDVTIKRWEDFTGKKARRIKKGS